MTATPSDPEALRRIVAEGRGLYIRAFGEAVRSLPDQLEAANAFHNWCLKHAHTVLSALESCALSPQQAQWQPMETAPRDGTQVLFWYDGSKYQERSHLIGKMTHFGGRWIPLIGCTLFSTEWEQFRGWQPLPIPPSEPKT